MNTLTWPLSKWVTNYLPWTNGREKQNYSCTAQLASTRIAFITIGNMPTTKATKTSSYMGLFKVLG